MGLRRISTQREVAGLPNATADVAANWRTVSLAIDALTLIAEFNRAQCSRSLARRWDVIGRSRRSLCSSTGPASAGQSLLMLVDGGGRSRWVQAQIDVRPGMA
jgi:hypothetical protein